MKNLYKALAQFQQECPIIHKDTQGFGYTYADLPKIFEVINPILAKHKLGFTQILNENTIKTVVFHYESGESIDGTVTIPYEKLGSMNIHQSVGSGITYYRRYALSSILGLVTDKDTDGADTRQVPKTATPTPAPKPKKLDELNEKHKNWEVVKKALAEGKTSLERLKGMYIISKEIESQLTA